MHLDPVPTLLDVLEIARNAYARLVGHALDEYPLEMCGLLAGPASDGRPGNRAIEFYPCHNDDRSARVYTVNPRDHMRAEQAADDLDFEINGVVHSHTHSEPYPSPTDVAAAVSADWHYVIVGLKREAPEVRSYRIVDGEIVAEPLVVV
jgi:[CysO sulfur-carrier protein]-S-L-cysteine hydrolase